MPLNISAAPLDGSWDLVAGTCKRIAFTVPLTPRSDQLQFVVQNMDFRAEKFVHWCGLNIKKVVYLSKGDIISLKSFVIFAKRAKVGGLQISSVNRKSADFNEGHFADLLFANPIFFLFADLKHPQVRKYVLFLLRNKAYAECSYISFYLKNVYKNGF